MRTFYIHTSSHSIPVANTILSSSRINLPVLYHLHPYSCICKCNKMTSQSSISPASTYTFVASTFDSFTIRRPARCTSTRIVSGELTVRAVGPSNGRMKSQTHSGVWRWRTVKPADRVLALFRETFPSACGGWASVRVCAVVVECVCAKWIKNERHLVVAANHRRTDRVSWWWPSRGMLCLQRMRVWMETCMQTLATQILNYTRAHPGTYSHHIRTYSRAHLN